MRRYVADQKYICSFDYIPYLREAQPGDEAEFHLVVLHSEAQARIEELEWLLECLETREVMRGRIEYVRSCATKELGATLKAARAAVGATA